jgi:regulator of extracellular matrix RemA (YlzA/DUF370 family)
MVNNILNLGYGNVIMKDKVVAILNINSAPIKKMISEARVNNLLYDVSQGRKSRSVVITTNHQVYLTAIKIETMTNRMINDNFDVADDKEEDIEEEE